MPDPNIPNLPPYLRRMQEACGIAGFDLKERIPPGGAAKLAEVCGVGIRTARHRVGMLRLHLGLSVNGKPRTAKKKSARKISDEQLESFGRSLDRHGFDPAAPWGGAGHKKAAAALGISVCLCDDLLRALRRKRGIDPKQHARCYQKGRGTDRVKDLIIEWGIDLVQPLSKALERQIATHLGMGVDNARRCIYAERKRLGVTREEVMARRQEDILRLRAERKLLKIEAAAGKEAESGARRLAQKAEWFEDAHLDLLADAGRDGRLKEILCRRFGLRGRKPETLQAIGDSLGITREAVRINESRVLNRIKQRIEGNDRKFELAQEQELAEACRRERGEGAMQEHELALSEAVDTPIHECDFSVRTWNVLTRMGIKTLTELARKTADDLMGERGFGVGCLHDVEKRLAEYGLFLAPCEGYDPMPSPRPLHKKTLLAAAKAVCSDCAEGAERVQDEDGEFWHNVCWNGDRAQPAGRVECEAGPIWHLLAAQEGGLDGPAEPVTVHPTNHAPSGAEVPLNGAEPSLRGLMHILSQEAVV